MRLLPPPPLGRPPPLSHPQPQRTWWRAGGWASGCSVTGDGHERGGLQFSQSEDEARRRAGRGRRGGRRTCARCHRRWAHCRTGPLPLRSWLGVCGAPAADAPTAAAPSTGAGVGAAVHCRAAVRRGQQDERTTPVYTSTRCSQAWGMWPAMSMGAHGSGAGGDARTGLSGLQ